MHSEIRAQLDVLTEQLAAEGYGDHRQRVRNLVIRCRAVLTRGTGRLGPWEAQQLEFAERAVAAGFLRLALIAMQTAIAVSELPVDEYDYGSQAMGHRPDAAGL